MDDPVRVTAEETISRGLKAAATVLAGRTGSPVVRQAREHVAAARDALKRLRNRDQELSEAWELIQALSDDLEEIAVAGDPWLPDWACEECRPDSDLLVEGFRCGRHRARAWLAATAQEAEGGHG